MLMTLLIFLVLLAFIFLGFPIFMALLITGLIFLITGGTLLVIVACVFMITRKKMSIYED